MKFQDKLKLNNRTQLWNEYCGFRDIPLSDYMYIQRRLMEEQMSMWCSCGLGKKILGNKQPKSINDFRRLAPLTTYGDYAEILLSKQADMLPADPIIWIQTTWEGGLRPIKLAPYSRAMLDKYRHNVIAVTMLASSRKHGEINIKKGDRVLYGGAPLPYITGLLPSILDEDIHFEWMPDTNSNSNLSFSQRIKKGFNMAMSGGLDYFFAIGSVASYITDNFGKSAGGAKMRNVSIPIACRYLRQKYLSRRDGKPLYPGKVFNLKGFVCTGTDAKYYKQHLAEAWGVVPIEIVSGTESTMLATENWQHNGMVFFPDSCFYEFIPEDEMKKSLENPSYIPLTCLMDEVHTNENYELVISVLNGGAFMRYRIGDVFHCLSAETGCLPRFSYIDRVPNVIDIAGFTRITESTINEVIRLSHLGIGEWIARKEYDSSGKSYLQMYIELLPEAQMNEVTSVNVLTEQMSTFFKYLDSDYVDLKKMLDMEPLRITVLKTGTMEGYRHSTGRFVPKMNPNNIDMAAIIQYQYPSREEVSCK